MHVGVRYLGGHGNTSRQKPDGCAMAYPLSRFTTMVVADESTGLLCFALLLVSAALGLPSRPPVGQECCIPPGGADETSPSAGRETSCHSKRSVLGFLCSRATRDMRRCPARSTITEPLGPRGCSKSTEPSPIGAHLACDPDRCRTSSGGAAHQLAWGCKAWPR